MTGAEGVVVRIAESAAKPIFGWLRKWIWPERSRTALTVQADDLANAVEIRESDLLGQLRAGQGMVIKHLEFQSEPQPHLGLPAGDAAVLGKIGLYYRRQESRRMAVLGEAGAGKTVLAVRFVLDQKAYRDTLGDAERGREPVPVRINAAGWDGSADFTTWLANQLAIDYALNARVARAMVDSRRILPVLDGLDEMDPPGTTPVLASAALARLNEEPWRSMAVVVMCRTRVYEAIRALRNDAGLRFATTVALQPVSVEAIYFYIEQYREEIGVAAAEWAPVTDQLLQADDGPLAIALRTPWLLSLATKALERGGHDDAVALAACSNTAEIRSKLFASLIPAAIEGTPRTGHIPIYSEEKVDQWLRTLAQHLKQRRTEHSGGTQIALDQIWELAGTRRCRALHALAAGLAVGLAAGLVFGLAAGLAVGLTVGLAVGLTFGLIASGLAAGLGGNVTAPKRFAWRVPGRSRWRRGLAVGPAAGLAVGLAVGLGVGLMLGPMVGLTFGLPAGLVAGLGGNITAPKRFAWRVPGRSRWRRGLTSGLVFGLLSGLVFGLTAGPTTGLPWLMTVFVFGLVFGLAAGLMGGLSTNSDERLALGQDARQVIHYDLVAGLAYGLAFGLATALTQGHCQVDEP